MMEILLGLLAGMVLVDTVILAHVWCRLLPPAERRRGEGPQSARGRSGAGKLPQTAAAGGSPREGAVGVLRQEDARDVGGLWKESGRDAGGADGTDEEEAARRSKAMEDGIENLMCYSVAPRYGRPNGAGQ